MRRGPRRDPTAAAGGIVSACGSICSLVFLKSEVSMQRRKSIELTAMALGVVALTAGVFAQQPPAGRGAAPQGPAAPAAGRGAAETATRPALLFKEEWKQ